ncbi:hypothetical protein BUALT_Bualt12G0119000 [Buddleja alternifolia]|uniref:Vitellogenin-like protein n=1 Tax=Buddleja alternifolia TaxID=168488 RepID=A0AAV6WXD7_9LAMI|nr:hypothetical protein BUALT_Bualt12G0119000 [Buddleja alternifolia]
MVMEVVHEDMGEGNVQCTNHPYKNSSPGGICALCLQEKLGKLVSSSFSVSVFPSSSSSSSPSLRSEFGSSTTSTAASASASAAAGGSTLQVSNSQSGGNDGCSNYNGYQARRLKKLPFVSTHKKNKSKNKNKDGVMMKGSDSSTSIVFKRSKSTTTPSRGTMQYLDQNYSEDYNSNSSSSSHTRGSFWSFLYLSKHSTTSTTTKKSEKDLSFTPATPSTVVGSSSVNGVGGPTNGSNPDDEASFDRKVSRSRSVGCGSRSFSGDFFERISTGFGDCTLRRVESQREGKSKMHRNVGGMNGHDCIKERVRCGGIFSGFMITQSSSYLVDNNHSNVNGKSISATHHHLSHGRNKSWGWAFASPMRAFSKPSTAKRDNKNATPNLAAIPSLLAVSS